MEQEVTEQTTGQQEVNLNNNVYVGENYEVTFSLDSMWDSGYNGTITIKNTGDSVIENWCVSFPLEQNISNIWNANIEEVNEDFFVIKNAGWNQDISVGGSVYEEEGITELDLYMLASEECEKFELYASKDGGEKEMLGTAEENMFSCTLNGDFSKMEVYARGYFTENTYAESEALIVEYVDGEYLITVCDTDEDRLSDFYELYFGTDINDTDSDDDEDGLTIYEEMNLDTDVWDDDSDDDGLLDGEEIILGTNPLLVDTDKDRINDGNEKFYQTFTHQVENEECVIEEVVVSLEGSGCLQTNTTIESIMETDWMCAEVVGLVGEPFDVKTEVKFDRATLTFKLDKDKLGETPFENLMFLWYDEENYKFVELETILDEENGTVSVETTHFSKYMIVDSEVWHNAWLVDLEYDTQAYDDYYTVLAIDCSGSMNGNDPITVNNDVDSQYDAMYRKSCNRIKSATEYINCMEDGDMTAIVFFDSSSYYTLPFTDDKTELKLALQKVKSYGGTSYNSPLRKAISLFNSTISWDFRDCKRVIMLTDGEASCSSSVINELKAKNIRVHGIGLGTAMEYDALRELTDATGGDCVLLESSDELQEIYKRLYEIDGIDTTDNDNDGLYDVYETIGMRLQNAKIIYTSVSDDDSDDDELLDGDEMDNEIKYGFVDYVVDGETYKGSGYYFVMKTDPNLADTDGDGIRDDVDEYPWIKFMENVVSLEHEDFVAVDLGNGACSFGGAQGWLEGCFDTAYGCGVIAMSNLELYLALYNDDFYDQNIYNELIDDKLPYEYYVDYATKRKNKYYYVIGTLGVLPASMELGINNKYNYGEATWAYTYNKNNAKENVYSMLVNNIPIVASYYTFGNDGLTLYKFDAYKLNEAQDIKSHYITITSIVEIYDTDDCEYKEYYCLSSWGKKYYIRCEKWLEKLNYFTNYLHIEYHGE